MLQRSHTVMFHLILLSDQYFFNTFNHARLHHPNTDNADMYCKNLLQQIPEKSIHSSPLRASGTPRTIKSRVFLVKNMLVPRPYSEKWMFQDCSFIFSLSCQTKLVHDTVLLFLPCSGDKMVESMLHFYSVAHPCTPTCTHPPCSFYHINLIKAGFLGHC